jgi:hypothetical protein
MDIGDVLGAVTPATRTVQVCLDGSVAEQLDHLRARWSELAGSHQGMAPSADVTDVIEEIRALEAQAETATVEFRVQALGAKAWRRLVVEHPPPADDMDGWRWDPETFPQASLAACCVSPAMTVEQAEQLAERLSNGQWGKLWSAVLDVNVGDDLIPKFGPATVDPPTSG